MLKSVEKFMSLAEEEHRKRVESLRWGDWVYHKGHMTLTNLKYDYEIDLEEVRSSAGILDWIYQIFDKGWGDPLAVYDLLEALGDLLGPQRNYCSGAILGGCGRSYRARQAINHFLTQETYET